MESKVLNEYYKDYLKKVSNDNIKKYNEEKREKDKSIKNKDKNNK